MNAIRILLGGHKPESSTVAHCLPLDTCFVFHAKRGTYHDFRDIHSPGGYDGFLNLYLELEKK
jgi:hypothetical protein